MEEGTGIDRNQLFTGTGMALTGTGITLTGTGIPVKIHWNRHRVSGKSTSNG